jgi:hypothetical protein
MTMAVWRWLVGLFLGKPVEKPSSEQMRFIDERAANAARAAGSGVNSSPPIG